MGARRARPRKAERPAGPREHAAAARARARAHRPIAVQVRRAQRGGREVRHARRVLKPHGGQALPASQRLRDGATAGSYQTCEGSEAAVTRERTHWRREECAECAECAERTGRSARSERAGWQGTLCAARARQAAGPVPGRGSSARAAGGRACW